MLLATWIVLQYPCTWQWNRVDCRDIWTVETFAPSNHRAMPPLHVCALRGSANVASFSNLIAQSSWELVAICKLVGLLLVGTVLLCSATETHGTNKDGVSKVVCCRRSMLKLRRPVSPKALRTIFTVKLCGRARSALTRLCYLNDGRRRVSLCGQRRCHRPLCRLYSVRERVFDVQSSKVMCCLRDSWHAQQARKRNALKMSPLFIPTLHLHDRTARDWSIAVDLSQQQRL